MQSNWQKAVSIVLGHEGGESNDVHDPGGHTNLGVTQDTLDRAREATDLDLPKGVGRLTTAQAKAVYQRLYWRAVKADELPAGLDVFAFDMAVNQGVDTAMRSLQEAAGTTVDGIWGPSTAGAIRDAEPKSLLIDFAALRGLHYAELSDDLVERFGHGWYRRLIRTFWHSLTVMGA
jgi:lysozyme family protein